MPRKKPFSGKRKKVQLVAKRDRKKLNPALADRQRLPSDCSDQEDVLEGLEDSRKAVGKETMGAVRIEGVNQQPASSDKTKQHDPNKYVLQYQGDSERDVERRKMAAKKVPLTALPPEASEGSVDDFHRPPRGLDIPKRPDWSYHCSKGELDAKEKEYFRCYLARTHSASEQQLSRFEHNLETWRQLWRVLERSDLVCIVVDIRFAPIHFPRALYHHAVDDLGKQAVLVLNKIDLVPPEVVVAWKHYFSSAYPKMAVVCFTLYPDPGLDPAPPPSSVQVEAGEVPLKLKKRRHRVLGAVGPQQLFKVVAALYQHSDVDLTSWARQLDGSQQSSSGKPGKTKITIGMLGFPNAGKSSIINGLLGRKVVSVSRTPGHTKHFQTILLGPGLTLCDCPGLVLPAHVPLPLQILSGIYPISQVREPYTVVGYVARRVPLVKLLRLALPSQGKPPSQTENWEEDLSRWTAWDVCDGWAEKRGYYTPKAARLDTYRAANSLLRLLSDGRIAFYLTPGGFHAERNKWLLHEDIAGVMELQRKGLQQEEGRGCSISSSSSSSEQEAEEETPFEEQSNPFSLLD